MGIEMVSASNGPEAYREVLHRMKLVGYHADSEKGQVITTNGPFVLNIYNPTERVLFDPVRDANPFFHLMEFMWMMAGEWNASWLNQFNKNISNYAEPDGSIHGAYGHRWRWMFGRDQLVWVYETLKEEPTSRRAVLQMWNGALDLQHGKKDYPCNTNAYFRINKYGALDLTICNRSNDIIWGMLGANLVHMTMLQEMMANTLGVAPGDYYVWSNNAHIYTGMPRFQKIWEAPPDPLDPYRGINRVEPYFAISGQDDIHTFLREATRFIRGKRDKFDCFFIREVVVPMYYAWEAHTCRDNVTARDILLTKMPVKNDWRRAALEWLDRRSTTSTSSTDVESIPPAPLAQAVAPVVHCPQPGAQAAEEMDDIPF